MEHAMPLLPRSNSVSAAMLPDELIMEILSFLPVKPLVRFKCVNKFFKTFITHDPHFVQMHLNNSSHNSQQQLALTYYEDRFNSSLVPLSIPGLLQTQFTMFHNDPYSVQMHLNNFSLNSQLALTSPPNLPPLHIGRQGIGYYEGRFNSSLVPLSIQYQFSMFRDDPNYQLNKYSRIVGSCNGLLLVGSSFHSYLKRDHWLWIYFWNPAMRTKSKKFWIFCSLYHHFNFSFGYDHSTRSYKVVAFYMERAKPGCISKSVVKVFSSRERFWRDIHCFPVYPLNCFDHYKNNGVHLNGTINWIGFRDYMINKSTTVDQYVILSLDLSTETYTQLLPPPRFDKVPRHQPKLVVLMGCLCFCHNFENTHFIIWQMKDFGVQDSWTQLFTISYRHQHFFRGWDLLPLYLSENGDTMIFANERGNKEAIIYNRRYNTAPKIEISNKILWPQANDYIESLVSTH